MWGSIPDWFQAIGVIVGFGFAIWQLKQATDQSKQEAMANKITAFFSIVDHMQSEHVRAARRNVRKAGPDYSQWTQEQKEDAQLAATSFDVAGAALRYGAFDLAQFGIVWRNTVLELAPLIEPHVEERRKQTVARGLPPEGAFENYRWLVREMKNLKV